MSIITNGCLLTKGALYMIFEMKFLYKMVTSYYCCSSATDSSLYKNTWMYRRFEVQKLLEFENIKKLLNNVSNWETASHLPHNCWQRKFVCCILINALKVSNQPNLLLACCEISNMTHENITYMWSKQLFYPLKFDTDRNSRNAQLLN